MLYRLLVFTGILFLFSYGFVIADDDTADVNPELRFTVTALGAYSYPLNNFSSHYLPGFSGGLKSGVNTDIARGKFGFNFYTAWYNDRFKVKNSDNFSSLNTINLAADYYFLYMTSGMGWGASRLDVPTGVYQNWGNNTGTELQEKNGKWNFSFDRYFGLRIPLGNALAIDCDYHFVSIEKAWMYWHSMLSGSIMDITEVPFDTWANNLAKQDHVGGAIILELISAAISWAWYSYDYNHHDWPWHDDQPMRFPRTTIGLTFAFGHIPQEDQ